MIFLSSSKQQWAREQITECVHISVSYHNFKCFLPRLILVLKDADLCKVLHGFSLYVYM